MADPTSALDAINQALGSPVEEGEPAELGEGDVGHASEGSEDAAAESEHEGAAGAEAAAPEGDAEAGAEEGEAADANRERNPDGTFKKKGDEKEAKPEGEKPAEGAKPAEVKKAPDALNDPIPKDLKPATQERIRTLVKTARELTTERDTVKADFDYLVKGVQATGATPEQYGEALSFLSLCNSNDPAQQEKALELVETMAEQLATLLGKERTVGDPLAKHADLKEAVTKGQVTAQYARELARVREQSGFRQQLSAQATAQNQQQQAAAQEMHQARTDLGALETNLRATDAQYEAKKAHLLPILKPIFAALPPAQWKGAFESAYKNLVLAAPAARKPVVPAQQPMRAGKVPTGGKTQESGSALDAVNAALAGMR